MRSRRRALDEAWTKKAGRTNSGHRVLVGTSKGSPVRGAAWRVSGFLSTAKAGRWLHTTKSLGGARAKPDMVRGGRSFSQGGWCRSPLHRASPNLFREKNRLGQRGTRTEAWSGPVFSCSQSRSGCRGRQSVILSRSDPNLQMVHRQRRARPLPCFFVFLFLFEQDSGRVDAKRDNLVKSVETRRAAPGSHAPTHPRKPPSHIHARAQPNAELIVGAWVPGWSPRCSWPSWWQQPGKPRILRIAKGNLPGILFSAARMRQRQATDCTADI